jgi:membrane protease subunit HflK
MSIYETIGSLLRNAKEDKKRGEKNMNDYGGSNHQPKPQMPEIPPGFIKKVVAGVVILLIVLLGSSMFYTVQEQEKAAILTFGKYTGTADSGLHFKFPYPIQQVVIVPAELTQQIHIGYRERDGKITTVEEEALMITGDENILSADAVVEWKISDPEKYLYNITEPEKFLRNAAISSIRSVIGSTNLNYAITEGKTEIQTEVKKKLLDLLEKYETGIFVKDIKFQDIEPPVGEVQQAFREVTNAREEKNTKINNANQYTNDRLPKARGEAKALLEAAEAEKMSRIVNAQGDVAKFNAIFGEYQKSPEVTQSRLILETLEKILPNAQIYITDSSSDTVKYLPLHELMRPTGSSGSTNSTSTAANSGGATQ